MQNKNEQSIMKITKLKNVTAQWFGTVDAGKKLEIIDENTQNIIATILADEKTEELIFEIYDNNEIIQFPLSKLIKIINLAEGEVHSEAWYEKNVYNDI